jgi:uncharacterized protein (TIGR02001 family)
MNPIRFTVPLTLALTLAPAQAEESSSALNMNGSITAASQYVLMGRTQSDDHPALQGALEVEHDSGLFGGVWGSTMDFPNHAVDHEVDYYLGYGTDLGQLSISVDYTWIRFPNHGDFGNSEEVGVMAATKAGPFEIGLSYTDARKSQVDTWEASIGTNIDAYQLYAVYGDQHLNGEYFSLGVAREMELIQQPLILDLSYHQYHADAGSGTSDEDHIVFSVTRPF